jgi:hypothetical protein
MDIIAQEDRLRRHETIRIHAPERLGIWMNPTSNPQDPALDERTCSW